MIKFLKGTYSCSIKRFDLKILKQLQQNPYENVNAMGNRKENRDFKEVYF